MADPILDLSNVTVVVGGRKILGPLDWSVEEGQSWIVIGANGSGKSTLVRVASLALHPTDGVVRVLDAELGRTDLRQMRARVGWASAALLDQLRPGLTANEIVRCGIHAALEPWWHVYSDTECERADQMLERVGLAGYGDRTLATLSSGERQRTLLARTLINDPEVLLLDEPNAGLDMGGREALVEALDQLATTGPPTVLVTHHVEDIPPTSTHLLALDRGRPVAKGSIEEVLSAGLLSELFGVEVELLRHGGRWSARVPS
ncbi:MAG: ATP-binding cassette domain-containing protein [Acidimicrobiia bacterium]|nr:ATP-binding cassette domain-containing protein [Acidimicrobiia bacterium]